MSSCSINLEKIIGLGQAKGLEGELFLVFLTMALKLLNASWGLPEPLSLGITTNGIRCFWPTIWFPWTFKSALFSEIEELLHLFGLGKKKGFSLQMQFLSGSSPMLPGLKIARLKKFLPQLRAAGLRSINLSTAGLVWRLSCQETSSFFILFAFENLTSRDSREVDSTYLLVTQFIFFVMLLTSLLLTLPCSLEGLDTLEAAKFPFLAGRPLDWHVETSASLHEESEPSHAQAGLLTKTAKKRWILSWKISTNQIFVYFFKSSLSCTMLDSAHQTICKIMQNSRLASWMWWTRLRPRSDLTITWKLVVERGLP